MALHKSSKRAGAWESFSDIRESDTNKAVNYVSCNQYKQLFQHKSDTGSFHLNIHREKFCKLIPITGQQKIDVHLVRIKEPPGAAKRRSALLSRNIWPKISAESSVRRTERKMNGSQNLKTCSTHSSIC